MTPDENVAVCWICKLLSHIHFSLVFRAFSEEVGKISVIAGIKEWFNILGNILIDSCPYGKFEANNSSGLA